MARDKGTFKFAATLEVTAAGALDPRMVVDTKADLINKETWPYKGDVIYVYEGLVVAVRDTKSLFMLSNPAAILNADYSGWKQLDAAAAGKTDVVDSLTSQSSTAALSANQGYILKGMIDELGTKLTAVYSYKGSKPTFAELPTDAVLGDVWNVEEAHEGSPAGTNWAWNGTEWDALGGSIDLSTYYTKDEIDNNFVKKSETGDLVLEGGVVVKNSDNTDSTILEVISDTVVVGSADKKLELVGSEARPSYGEGENKKELALVEDVNSAKNQAIQAAKDYADQKVGDIDLSNLVEKEDGKELIPTDKLALIDTNASDITQLRTDVDAVTADVETLKSGAAKIDASAVITGVGAVTAATETVTVPFNKSDKGTNANFVAGEATNVVIPAATTTTAGVMTASDKSDLVSTKSAVTSLNSTTEALTASVETLNGTEATEGSVRNLAKAAAEKAVGDGMNWVEVVAE